MREQIRVGFTGTRRGLCTFQRDIVALLLTEHRKRGKVLFIHGDCVGADADAHNIARDAGCFIISYPYADSTQRAYCNVDEGWEPDPNPLRRNHRIVDNCDVLIACPSSNVEVLRSGTWATIRYARKVGKPLALISGTGRINEALRQDFQGRDRTI